MTFSKCFHFVLAIISFLGFSLSSQAQDLLNSKASRLKIAVIDTGADFDHNFLDRYIRIPTRADGVDENGHGTHIVGIIVQHLKEKTLDQFIEIVPINFFSKSYSDSELTQSFTQAMQRAMDLKVDIINISVGGPHPYNEELEILKKAREQGILVVAAAGNKKPGQADFAFYPAAYNLPHVLSVVGTNADGEVLQTSNTNIRKNNLYFPGKDIRSTLPGNRFGLLTGSSQAAAVATAEVASLWLKKGKEFIWNQFINTPRHISLQQSHF